MRVGFAQINPIIGNFEYNFQKISDAIVKAKSQKVDLLLFPELAVCGYPPRDLLEDASFIKNNLKTLDKIKNLTKDITVVVGYAEPAIKKTKKLYNSAAVFQNKKQVGNYRKQLLPFYDVFEEERHFEPGDKSCVVKVAGKRVGITICEDIWNQKGFLDYTHAKDPVAAYKGKIDLLANISASPFHLGKTEKRLALLKFLQKKLKCAVALCNQMGAQDELLFDGGSVYVDSKNLYLCPVFQEGVFVEPEQKTWPKDEAQWLIDALTRGIKDYVQKTKNSKVILGLSGGIDSGVCVALAVEALGRQNVIGVSLPSPFSSPETKKDAVTIAKNLGIEFHEIPIDGMMQESQKALQFLHPLSDLTQQNIQPRLRAVILMAIANQKNALLLNTSNKVELATGYSTLYGDTAGALGVLGDLTKEQVYKVANYINRDGNIIPKSMIDRAPSAELKPNQKDEDTLPPFAYLNEKVPEFLETQKISGEEARKFLKLYEQSEFKRRQFPPILRVSKKAFGIGRRIPIVKQRG